MTGILLLGVALIWLIVVVLITRHVANRFESTAAITLCVFVLGPLLFFLPLADEIVGAFQFNGLCKRYAVQSIDEERAGNRRVVYVPRGEDKYIVGPA